MSVPSDGEPHPGRDRDRAAAARAARDPGRVVRVARLRARHPERELVRRGLAEDHGAGRAPEVDAVGVDLRHGVVGVRAAAGADAADVDDVLDGDRDAVQRAAPPAGLQLGVAHAGLGQRVLGADLDERGPLVAARSAPARARVSSTQVVVAGVERPRGGGDRAGPRQPAERRQRRGRRPEDVVRRPPLRRVDDLRLQPLQRGREGGGGDAHGRSSSNMRASSSPTRRSTTSALTLDVHAHQRGGGIGAAGADGLQDLQVLLDRRLDPVRRREVVDPDQADALVDVADVALVGAVAGRAGDALVEALVGVDEVGPVVVLAAQVQPLGDQPVEPVRRRRCGPRGPRARPARRRARA